jgi:hypothetical protein
LDLMLVPAKNSASTPALSARIKLVTYSELERNVAIFGGILNPP